MPLDWLGQLSPTMQQQIALQRALLALQREDEQIRLKTMPQTAQPALARGLGGGTQPYAGPTPTLAEGKKEPSITPSYFRPGAGSLEEALRAAAPKTGSAIDIRGAAWAKRKEMAEGRVIGAKEAYDRIITLDPAGQKVALNALRKYKSEVYNAMEKEGYLSPAGELVQPAKENAPLFVNQYISGGWIHERTTFADGTTTDEVVAPAPEEAVEEPSVSDIVAAEELGIKKELHAERHHAEIIKMIGHMPVVGVDMVGDELATQENVNSWMESYALANAILSARAGETVPEGEATMSKAQAEFEASTGEVKMAIQQKLGVPQTGEWDEATEFAMSTYGEVLLGEKPVKELTEEEKLEAKKNMTLGGAL